MPVFAAVFSRSADGWTGTEVDVADLDEIDDVADLMRDVAAAVEADETAVVLVAEADDEWFGIARIDDTGDPRAFLSDLRVVYGHPAARLFLEDGRLGLLDFGCMVEHTAEEWELMRLSDRPLTTGRRDDRMAFLKLWLSLPADAPEDDSLKLLDEFAEVLWRPRSVAGEFEGRQQTEHQPMGYLLRRSIAVREESIQPVGASVVESARIGRRPVVPLLQPGHRGARPGAIPSSRQFFGGHRTVRVKGLQCAMQVGYRFTDRLGLDTTVGMADGGAQGELGYGGLSLTWRGAP